MAKTTMTTVDRALALLRHFSVQTPEFGLSELARLSGYDKTTTLRCMTALERNGFVEQDATTRRYRLGLAPMYLAQIREQSFPVRSVIKRYLDDLTQSLGETAHGTLIQGGEPMTVGISEPDRALYVHIGPSEVLPWHATASGIAILAHLPWEKQTEILARPSLQVYTEHTPTQGADVQSLLDACRADGLGRASETYESEVVGTAAPIFGPSGAPIGAVAIAAVSLRFTPELKTRIDAGLRDAARDITQELGGRAPAAPDPSKDASHAAH